MSGLTLNDLKCDNTGLTLGTWIYIDAKYDSREEAEKAGKVVGPMDVLIKHIGTVIGNRVLKIGNITKNIVLKFYYVDEKNQQQYITFNKNCQMIYDDARFNDDGTPVEVPESVKTKPVHIEETELTDEEFKELMEQSPLLELGNTEVNGGKKRRSSHKKRRSSHKKRRSSHKKCRSSHKKRRSSHKKRRH